MPTDMIQTHGPSKRDAVDRVATGIGISAGVVE